MPTQIKPHSLDATRNYTFANTTVNTLTINTNIVANGGVGSAGQVLTSAATGNAYWASITVSPTLDNILTNGATSTRTIGVGNTTITGFANVTSTLQVAANVVLGTTTITANGGVGSAGAVLTSGGAGNVYWAAASGGGATLTANTTDTQTFYLPMANTTSGSWSNAVVSSTNLYFVPSTGRLSATIFNALSDRTKKKDFEQITDVIAKVRMLTGYTYTLIDSNERSAGLVSQDAQLALPESVHDQDGIQTLNYNGIVALLTEAVKVLCDKVETLEQSNGKN